MKKMSKILMMCLVALGSFAPVYASESVYTGEQMVMLLEQMDESLSEVQITEPGVKSWEVVTEDGLTGTVTVETVAREDSNLRASNGLDKYKFNIGSSYTTTVTKDFLGGRFEVITDWVYASGSNLKITGVDTYSKPPMLCTVGNTEKLINTKSGTWVKTTASTTWEFKGVPYTTETITKISIIFDTGYNIGVSWWV